MGSSYKKIPLFFDSLGSKDVSVLFLHRMVWLSFLGDEGIGQLQIFQT